MEESNVFNIKDIENNKEKRIDNLIKKLYYLIFIFALLNLITFTSNFFRKTPLQDNKGKYKIKENKEKYKMQENNLIINDNITVSKDLMPSLLPNDRKRLILKEINKKRTFENRLPLRKELRCNTHYTKNELVAFLSFLTKDTIFFETGSGCSSIFAKYYTKKSYAIEGCKKWYNIGVKNGLKENLIFRDLKPDKSSWSYPGKKSNINDWKQYFQSYDSKYNADVIFLDGRFKVATAMDIYSPLDAKAPIHLEYKVPLFLILLIIFIL